MMKYTEIGGGVCAAKGFSAGGVHAGFRKNTAKLDLAMVVADDICTAAGVFTKNKVFAAPVGVTKAHLSAGHARAIIANSGNANACTPDGYETAGKTCDMVASLLGIPAEEVIVASTGVIGVSLPLSPIENSLAELYASLTPDAVGAGLAAGAIMTTDTKKKEFALSYTYDGCEIHIGGMCKGSGMIHPNMGTMLGFITTDAAIDPELLHKALLDATEDSFNMVSVDGDTSTNDMVCVLASGKSDTAEIDTVGDAYDAFAGALSQICMRMAAAIAADGEGATKFLRCTVSNAADDASARILAKSVIASSLVKAAMFGADANWGRVICALGYSGVDFDPALVDISFRSPAGTLDVCAHGGTLLFDEEKAKEILTKDSIEILCDMHAGCASATAFGCDLSYEYVRINGDYRT